MLAVIAKDPAALDVSFAGVDEVVRVSVEQEEFEGDVALAAVEALIAARRPRATLLGLSLIHI